VNFNPYSGFLYLLSGFARQYFFTIRNNYPTFSTTPSINYQQTNTKMESIRFLSHSFNHYRMHGSGQNIVKLMVIVDEQHLGMLDKIMHQRKWGVQVVYILTDSPSVKALFRYHSRIYPIKANIKSLLRYDIVDEIVCCTSSLPDEYVHDLMGICTQFGVSLLVQPNLGLSGVTVSDSRFIGNFYFQVLETNPRNSLAFASKSLFERTFAALALLALSPFLVLIAVMISLFSPGPVIFKQLRVGLRGRKFYIYKFRTMIVDAEKQKAALAGLNETDGPAFKIARDPRITRFGRMLRRSGIDEIPQLYNVIRGEMSLIGPRPMLPDEVTAQKEWQLKRMCIKPGITCTWQIQPNRNKVPFERWMQLDREYVENWSITGDIRIFCGTIRSIFTARGL
jgi:lipopolysaccharide/colanic/teichoic acid biosynthesis glycosyltransferase